MNFIFRKVILATHAALFCLVCNVQTRLLASDDILSQLDLRQVKVGGEIGRRIDVTVGNNLMVVDVDKDFLAPLHERKADSGYVGLGKLIDSAVRFAAYTNDRRVVELKNRLINETVKTQEPDGYIGILAPAARMHGMWDIHEMGYIVYGLTSDYHYFGSRRSLDAARKLADYIIKHWSQLPNDWDRQTQIATHVSVTGLERAMLTLHRQTGDRRYLDFCLGPRALPEWDLGIVIGRRELIEGHIYAYLARCLAQLELFRLQDDQRLLQPAHRAVKFMTENDGLCITGAAGQWEIWTDDQDGRSALGETCATAYQLRVYDSLLRLEGDSRYGDLMERTIHNALFAAQSPDGRHIRYYSPLEGPREYYHTDTYCCPCNYRRIVSDLPMMVYYRSSKGLAVNLYTPSEAKLELAGGVALRVKQETDYPASGRVTIQFNPTKPTEFPLQLRIPRWCKTASVTINDQPFEGPVVPGKFLTIERRWQSGDRVILDMPMQWRFVAGRKRQAGRAAVMRGPIVYCLNPAQDQSLAHMDAADLCGIMLYPDSLQEVAEPDSGRPSGVGCAVKGGKPGYDMWSSGNLSLRLTPFVDPDGQAVYFRLPDPAVAVPDELLSGAE